MYLQVNYIGSAFSVITYILHENMGLFVWLSVCETLFVGVRAITLPRAFNTGK